MKTWDYFEYRIAEHLLPAMINGDFSGMTEDEISDYREFEQQAFKNACEAGFTVGHWAPLDDSDEDWGMCDGTGLFAMRYTVRLMVYKESAPC